MASAERSVTINRPAAEVFDYLAEGANGTAWRSGVLDIAKESGNGVGARYRQRVRGPMGRRVAADYEITAHEPGKRLEFKATAGPVRPTGGYKLSESGGKTKVSFWLREELTGWKRFVLGRSVQKSMDAEMKALDKLKSVLEGGAAGRAAGGGATGATTKAKSSTDTNGATDTKASTATPKPAPSKSGAARPTAASKAAAAKAAAAKPAAPRTARRKSKAS
jgi:uncharacterized protein YndB with AHSA1/START domain